MYCSNSFLGGRPVTTAYELQPCQADGVTGEPGLAVGDTVRVTGSVCWGLVGELKTIDPEEADGSFYGVALDAIEGWIFFREDELERVAPDAVSQAGDPACTCRGRGCAWCNEEIYCAEEF